MAILGDQPCPAPQRRSNHPPPWTTGAACLVLALSTVDVTRACLPKFSGFSSNWAAPVDEAAFAGPCVDIRQVLSDTSFTANGWRWAPGSTALVGVLVQIRRLEAVVLSRFGGLHGP